MKWFPWPLRHHGVFRRFTPFKGHVPFGFTHDFIGALTSSTFHGAPPSPEIIRAERTFPAQNEEYFEWIDLLSSVLAAQESYTVVELGAGYGRWAARACLAAMQKGLHARAILVEAEPVHATWARQHMVANGIEAFEVIEAAAGLKRGKMNFAVLAPPEWNLDDPAGWYGQAMYPGEAVETEQTYQGRKVSRIGKWGTIEVNVLPLSEILKGVDVVDFLDMDIQGAEGEVVPGGRDVLADKVKLLHVGTHSTEAELAVRQTMTQLGWKRVWDFPFASKTPTPYGVIEFQDGVQSWKNPKFT